MFEWTSFRYSIAVCYSYFVFFFFKQKTAYEMRISDWSSDVCSSDLPALALAADPDAALVRLERVVAASAGDERVADAIANDPTTARQIGRASCRERVCQYV